MYDFYVLYLHVIYISRSGAPVVKMWNHSTEPKSAALLGNSIQEIWQLKWLSTKTKWPDIFFFFTNAAFACMSDESKKVRKHYSLIMFQLGSKSPSCTTWICSCTVWLRTLAMRSISIAVCFTLEFLFWYCFSFLFILRKGILSP